MPPKTETYKESIKRKDAEFKQGKPIKMKDIGRKGRHFWQREAWTFVRQHNMTDKVFVVERIRRVRIDGRAVHAKTAKTGDVEYRIGYYVIGRNGSKKGRWTWGQFCPLIPQRDFSKLIKKATREGTIV
jgi:hypothetical protein